MNINSMTENVGKAIRYERLRVRMTQEELAVQLGMNVNTLSAYETGKTVPALETIQEVAKIFGCDPMLLLMPIEGDYGEGKRVRPTNEEKRNR